MTVNGNVPVSYGTLPDGIRGTDETVKLMASLSMGRYGARSPKIRALAIDIVNAGNVPEKNYVAEMVAIHNWVRDQIRYTRDVAGQETLLPPEELAFNSKAGDCDDKSMLEAALLGSIGIPTRFVTIGVDSLSFSHVFLQALPKKEWISLDPIMRGKPAGWEAPAERVKVRKVYPINASEVMNMRGNNMNGLGLGYVGDNRVWSHLSPEPAPGPAAPPYVVMDSFLDQDAPMSQISRDAPAFPQQDVSVMRQPMATRMDPRLRNMRNINNVVRPHRSAAESVAQEAETEAQVLEAATNPLNGVGNDMLGPHQLAGLGAGIDRQRPDAYMQRPALAQRPDGVDVMFTRPNLISKFDKNDHVVFRGMYALNERPPIRPVTAFAGLAGDRATIRHPGSAIPGMSGLGSISGPGMAELADLAEDTATAASNAPVVSVMTPAPFYKNPLVLLAAAAVGGYLLTRKKRKA